MPEHPAELAAAEDADRRGRLDRSTVGLPCPECRRLPCGDGPHRTRRRHRADGRGQDHDRPELAERLGWAWRDSDLDIEAATGGPSASCATAKAWTRCIGVRRRNCSTRSRRRNRTSSARPPASSRTRAPRRAGGAGCRGRLAPRQPAVLATRFDSADEHRPAYGPDPEAFLADQAAHREPLLAGIGAPSSMSTLDPGRGRRAGLDALGSIGRMTDRTRAHPRRRHRHRRQPRPALRRRVARRRARGGHLRVGQHRRAPGRDQHAGRARARRPRPTSRSRSGARCRSSGRSRRRPRRMARRAWVTPSCRRRPRRSRTATRVDVILDEARRRPGEITLVTLGPLTNLALAVAARAGAARACSRATR